MILIFDKYTITLSVINDIAKVVITPQPEDKDKSDIGTFINSEMRNPNSDFNNFFRNHKLNSQKMVLKSQINNTYQGRIDSILNQYPSAEVVGWTMKAMQANLWLSTPEENQESIAPQVGMLIAEAGGSEDYATITNLAQKIKMNSNDYQAFHGEQTRIRYDLIDKLDLVTTTLELEEFKIYMNNILGLD